VAARPAVAGALELDRLIHERIRLGIVSALAISDALSFNELKRLLKTTDGNLSVHASRLEAGHYISASKSFHGRLPKTEFRLTDRGRVALERYLDQIETLIRATRESLAASEITGKLRERRVSANEEGARRP
jgi:DNA-binding PadR family transcriptional regulator